MTASSRSESRRGLHDYMPIRHWAGVLAYPNMLYREWKFPKSAI